MRGAIPPLPQYAFMAWCLVKHRDNVTFTFTLSILSDDHKLHIYDVNYLLIPADIGSATGQFVVVGRRGLHLVADRVFSRRDLFRGSRRHPSTGTTLLISRQSARIHCAALHGRSVGSEGRRPSSSGARGSWNGVGFSLRTALSPFD
jgi:hypothetical protein